MRKRRKIYRNEDIKDIMIGPSDRSMEQKHMIIKRRGASNDDGGSQPFFTGRVKLPAEW